MKRARRTDKALRAMLTNYLDAVISSRGVLLVRGSDASWLNDDEMDRLCEEWRLFRMATHVDVSDG